MLHYADFLYSTLFAWSIIPNNKKKQMLKMCFKFEILRFLHHSCLTPCRRKGVIPYRNQHISVAPRNNHLSYQSFKGWISQTSILSAIQCVQECPDRYAAQRQQTTIYEFCYFRSVVTVVRRYAANRSGHPWTHWNCHIYTYAKVLPPIDLCLILLAWSARRVSWACAFKSCTLACKIVTNKYKFTVTVFIIIQ